MHTTPTCDAQGAPQAHRVVVLRVSQLLPGETVVFATESQSTYRFTMRDPQEKRGELSGGKLKSPILATFAGAWDTPPASAPDLLRVGATALFFAPAQGPRRSDAVRRIRTSTITGMRFEGLSLSPIRPLDATDNALPQEPHLDRLPTYKWFA